MTKSQIKQAAKEKPFKEFDPTMSLRKGGKLGRKSFKSKSKFKRRQYDYNNDDDNGHDHNYDYDDVSDSLTCFSYPFL